MLVQLHSALLEALYHRQHHNPSFGVLHTATYAANLELPQLLQEGDIFST